MCAGMWILAGVLICGGVRICAGGLWMCAGRVWMCAGVQICVGVWICGFIDVSVNGCMHYRRDLLSKFSDKRYMVFRNSR